MHYFTVLIIVFHVSSVSASIDWNEYIEEERNRLERKESEAKIQKCILRLLSNEAVALVMYCEYRSLNDPEKLGQCTKKKQLDVKRKYDNGTFYKKCENQS